VAQNAPAKVGRLRQPEGQTEKKQTPAVVGQMIRCVMVTKEFEPFGDCQAMFIQ